MLDLSQELVVWSGIRSELESAAKEAGVLSIEGHIEGPQVGYKTVAAACGRLGKYRIAIAKRRKELKAESLEVGRKIDAKARELTAIVEPTERALQSQVDAVDAIEKAKVAAAAKEAAEALQAKCQALLDLGFAAVPAVVSTWDEPTYQRVLLNQVEVYNAKKAELERQEEERRQAEAKRAGHAAIENARLEAERREFEELRDQERMRQAEERRMFEERMAAENFRLAEERRRDAAIKAELDRKVKEMEEREEAERAKVRAAEEAKEAEARAQRVRDLEPEVLKVARWTSGILQAAAVGAEITDVELRVIVRDLRDAVNVAVEISLSELRDVSCLHS